MIELKMIHSFSESRLETLAEALTELSYSNSNEAASLVKAEGKKIGYSEYLMSDGSHVTIDINGQVYDTTADYKHHRSTLGLDKAPVKQVTPLTADELLNEKMKDKKRERREKARRIAAFPKFGTV